MIEYDYECKNCNTKFTISIASILGFNVSEVSCPSCKGKNIKKIWYAPGISYKGDGFTKKAKKVKDETI